MTALIPTEAAAQAAVIEWAAYNEARWPELRWLHHIPNQRTSPVQRMNLARQGVRAGIADLFLPAARIGFHGLYIEMKAAKGRLRPEQKAFLDFANEQGYYAVVCHSAEEAIAELQGYLNHKRYAWEIEGEQPAPTSHSLPLVTGQKRTQA